MQTARVTDVVLGSRNAASSELRVQRRGTVRGLVEDVTTQALLAGVSVYLIGSDDMVLASVQTDDTGSYRFEGLRAGKYSLRILPPRGYEAIAIEQAVEVGAGGEAEAHFDVRLSGIVRGKVIDEDTEEPLVGVSVNLYDSRGRYVSTVTTDEKGEYVFVELPEDKYTVEIDG